MRSHARPDSTGAENRPAAANCGQGGRRTSGSKPDPSPRPSQGAQGVDGYRPASGDRGSVAAGDVGSIDAMDTSPVMLSLTRLGSSPVALAAAADGSCGRGGGAAGGLSRRHSSASALGDCAPTPAPAVLGEDELFCSQVGTLGALGTPSQGCHKPVKCTSRAVGAPASEPAGSLAAAIMFLTL